MNTDVSSELPWWFISSKRKLTNRIEELLARFEGDDSLFHLDASLEAAAYAPLLAFPVPPLEHFRRDRGQRDRYLDANPAVIHDTLQQYQAYRTVL